MLLLLLLLLLLLHLYLHLPKTHVQGAPNRCIYRFSEQAAHFSFGNQVSPWEGLGESQIYLPSDFYRRGCRLMSLASAAPRSKTDAAFKPLPSTDQADAAERWLA